MRDSCEMSTDVTTSVEVQSLCSSMFSNYRADFHENLVSVWDMGREGTHYISVWIRTKGLVQDTFITFFNNEICDCDFTFFFTDFPGSNA